jgi:hypothetical protein
MAAIASSPMPAPEIHAGELHDAVRGDDYADVDTLVARGADVTAREDSGLTILPYAADRSTGGDPYRADINETHRSLGALE